MSCAIDNSTFYYFILVGILGINQGLAALMRVFAPLIGTALLGVNLGLPFFFGGGLLALVTILFIVAVKNGKTIEKEDKSIGVMSPAELEKTD